ncbi:MAG: type II secretion system F family protein [bacterium]
MLFTYKAVDPNGSEQNGSIDALNVDVAINSLQHRGFVIKEIHSSEEGGSVLNKQFEMFNRISNKDVVVVSRQLATLFEAQVSALRVFRLIANETPNKALGLKLQDIPDRIQGGESISKAMEHHSKVFSSFFVNMVKAGEESGKLDQTFMFLADYLDRNYEVSSKAKNALIYPSFVIATFFAVMGLMLTMVIPKITGILKDSGQEIPMYTKAVMAISDFLVNYGVFFLIALVVGFFFFIRFVKTPSGKSSFDAFKLAVPFVGDLYKKLYLSRIADNMNTMLTSGIPMVRALEITKDVVDNEVYHSAMEDVLESVKGGTAVSDAMSKHPEIPGIMTAMMKIGEETGNLGEILSTLAKFYRREVMTAVDTLVDLIEPIMIVMLGLGVGILLASVLIPIYNVSSAF